MTLLRLEKGCKLKRNWIKFKERFQYTIKDKGLCKREVQSPPEKPSL